MPALPEWPVPENPSDQPAMQRSADDRVPFVEAVEAVEAVSRRVI